MPESSKEERKIATLNKGRGRETNFTFKSAAQTLTFLSPPSLNLIFLVQWIYSATQI